MGKYRKYKWRVVADNDVEREIVEHLRRSGFDVLWATESPALKNRDDQFHFENARQMPRYLLTKDLGFWDDRKHPLKSSPGVIIVTTSDVHLAKWLPVLLRKLLRGYNPVPAPLYLDGIKVKVGAERVVIKMVDGDTQMVTTDSWQWRDLF
jgi:predicted nuclease of predicted toxin-antitoxin system